MANGVCMKVLIWDLRIQRFGAARLYCDYYAAYASDVVDHCSSKCEVEVEQVDIDSWKVKTRRREKKQDA